MPDIRALDKRALEMFERDAFSDLSPLRILLGERKVILNDRFIYNDETRKLLRVKGVGSPFWQGLIWGLTRTKRGV